MSDVARVFLRRGLCLFLVVGCTAASSTTSPDAGADAAGRADLGFDVGVADRVTADVGRPADVTPPIDVVDVADVAPTADVVDVADVAEVVDARRCDPAVGCRSFWCGCGRCEPSAITCVPEERGCPLDCVSFCPELETAACSCSDASCGGPTFPAADAGADAGGLAAGEPCSGDAVCATGLLCCYVSPRPTPWFTTA